MKEPAMSRSIAARSARTTPRLRLLSRLLGLMSLHRQRRSLAHLDDHLLRDIGLTPEQAQMEATRPLWDAPAHWRG